MEPSDETLVLACRQGDESAWEMLVKRYQRLIYSIPRRTGMNRDLAEDVFQNVLATLLENLNNIEYPSRVRTWLVTTTQRETWRVSRRARMAESAVDTDEDRVFADLPDDALLPDEVLVRIEAQNTVRMAVEALDERCQTLLKLLFYQTTPPPYTEIAARLGTSEGSIGPTRARCLQKLRQLLTEMGVTFAIAFFMLSLALESEFYISSLPIFYG